MGLLPAAFRECYTGGADPGPAAEPRPAAATGEEADLGVVVPISREVGQGTQPGAVGV